MALQIAKVGTAILDVDLGIRQGVRVPCVSVNVAQGGHGLGGEGHDLHEADCPRSGVRVLVPVRLALDDGAREQGVDPVAFARGLNRILVVNGIDEETPKGRGAGCHNGHHGERERKERHRHHSIPAEKPLPATKGGVAHVRV